MFSEDPRATQGRRSLLFRPPRAIFRHDAALSFLHHDPIPITPPLSLNSPFLDVGRERKRYRSSPAARTDPVLVPLPEDCESEMVGQTSCSAGHQVPAAETQSTTTCRPISVLFATGIVGMVSERQDVGKKGGLVTSEKREAWKEPHGWLGWHGWLDQVFNHQALSPFHHSTYCSNQKLPHPSEHEPRVDIWLS